MSTRYDTLPPKYFEPLKGDLLDGKMAIDKRQFKEMIKVYYEIAGWDEETGIPRRGKLLELGLYWLAE